MQEFKAFQTSTIWQFQDPDTGYIYKAKNKADLISNIVTYRAQNKLETIERLDLVVSNYLCSLPQNCGKCEPTALKRGLIQYIKGGISLLQNLYYGEVNIVTQEEADRRAKLCADCIFNEFPDRDMFIQWSDNIALHSVGERRSQNHDKLGNCSCCTCPLRAKVFYKGPFKLSEEEKTKMQSANVKCWQLG